MAKTIKIANTGSGVDYKPTRGRLAAEKGLKVAELDIPVGGLSSKERNRMSQVFYRDTELKQIKSYFRDKHSGQVKEDDVYKSFREGGGSHKDALTAAQAKRQSDYDAVGQIEKLLDAQIRDVKNKTNYGLMPSIVNSFAQGAELLISPIRANIQGTEEGMAYQEAARLVGYHEPDSVMDKYANLTIANAPTMGTAIGAAFVPVVGPALSGAVMGSHMGTDMYYDLVREGVPKAQARDMAVLGGTVLAGIEMYTGKMFTSAAGKIPGMGRIVGSGGRSQRLNALRKSFTGTSDVISQAGGKVNLEAVKQSLKKVFKDTSRLQALSSLAREGGTEALVGGVEEWLQEGAQMAMTEVAVTNEGLESTLPQLPDGRTDYSAILDRMNDAFIAGFILEGGMGGVMTARSISSKMESGKFMEGVKTAMRGHIGDFSNEGQDFVARHTLLGVLNKTEAARKKNKVADLSAEQKSDIYTESLQEAVNTLKEDPLQSMMLDYGGDIEVKELIPDTALTMDINGTPVTIVKAGKLHGPDGKRVAAQFHKTATDAASIGVSDETWAELVELGATEDVIAMNVYQGSTLGHEVVHSIIQNMPEGAERTRIMDMFDNRDVARGMKAVAKAEGLTGTDAELQAEMEQRRSDVTYRQEAPAEAMETYQAGQRRHPLFTKFADMWAYVETGVLGENARVSQQQRRFLSGVGQTIRTSAPTDASYTTSQGVVTPARATISRIGQVGRGIGKQGLKTAHRASTVVREGVSKIVDPGPMAQQLRDDFTPLTPRQRESMETQKNVDRLQSADARISYGRRSVFVRQKIEGYVDAYGDKNDFTDQQREDLTVFLWDTFKMRLNKEKGLPAYEQPEAHREMIKSIEGSSIPLTKAETDAGRTSKGIITEMQIFSKQILKDAKMSERARKDYVFDQFTDAMGEYESVLEDKPHAVSETQRAIHEAEIMAVFRGSSKDKALDFLTKAIPHEKSAQARAQIESYFTPHEHEAILDAARTQNIEASMTVGRAEVEAGSQQSEELAQREFAASHARTDESRKVIDSPVGENVTIQSIRRAGLKATQAFDKTILPLTSDAYYDIFSQLSDTTNDRSSYDVNDQVSILRVGNMEFDLENNLDTMRIAKMTELFGPNWAVVAETELLRGESNLSQDIESANARIIEGKLARTPSRQFGKDLQAAALYGMLTQSDSLSKVRVPDTERYIQMLAETFANDIVDYAAKELDLPSDGSSVLFSEIEGRQETEIEDFEELTSLIKTDKSTAEDWTRDIIRDLSETFAGRLGGEGVRRIMNFKAKGDATAAGMLTKFKRADIKDELGRVMNARTAEYEMLRKAREAGIEGVAYENSIGADIDQVNSTLETLHNMPSSEYLKKMADITGSEAKAEQLRLILDAQGAIMADEQYESIQGLSEIAVLDEAARVLSEGIDEWNGIYAQALKDTSVKSALAQTLLNFQDQAFGLRDVRNIRTQIKLVQLHKEYSDIFGIEPEYRLRDIVRNLWNDATGTKTGDRTGSEARSVAEQYSQAMHFAIDVMNNEDSKVPTSTQLDVIEDAIDNTIEDLEKKTTLTVDENDTLAKYKEYKSVLPLTEEIIDGTGEFGKELQAFIKGPYSTLAGETWDMLSKNGRLSARKEKYYSPRVFVENETKPDETPEESFSVITGRMLGRTKFSLADHLQKGRVLRFDDFMVNFAMGSKQLTDVVANQDVIKSNLGTDFFSLKAKPGFEMLRANGARNLMHVDGDGKLYDTYREAIEASKGDPDKVDVTFQEVYAPTEIATYFNRITRNSPFRRTQFGLGLMATNAKLKAIKINFGMFHRRGLLWSAMIAGKAAPGYAWFKGDKSFIEKVKYHTDYASRRELGVDLMMQHTPEFYGLTYHGMTTFQVQDIGAQNLQFRTKAERFLAGERRGVSVQNINKFTNKFSKLTQRLQGELFGMFGSSLKTATAHTELQALLVKHKDKIAAEKEVSRKADKLAPHIEAYIDIKPEAAKQAMGNDLSNFNSATENEIYKAVAGMANADFGGLHTERLGMSKGAKDAMRLLLLGPDWTASNVISALKLHRNKNASKGGTGTVFSGSEMEQAIYKEFWLRIIGRSLALATVINLMMAGLDDESTLQRYKKAIKRGKFRALKADISPAIHMLGGSKEADHYLNTLGHFIDPAKMLADPARMAYHKSSAVMKPVLDLMSGTRYDMKRPTKISKIGELGLYTWKSNRRGPIGIDEFPSYMTYQVIQTLPIQFKNLFEVFSGEANVITGTMKAGMGLDVSRTYDKN